MISSSAAQVVHAFLTDHGLLQNTNQKDDWWGTIGMKVTEPYNAVFVYDTTGVKDGKLMTDGRVVKHDGVQIVVRGKTYKEGYKRATAIMTALAAAAGEVVTVGSGVTSENVVLCSFTVTSLPAHLGQENDKVRELFSLNGTVTLRESP